MQDYYKILEVSKDASQEEIKQSYRMLAKKWHPDANGNTKESEEKFKAINEAYSHLSSPDKRKEYDVLSSFNNSTRYDFTSQGRTNRDKRTYSNGEWEFTYTYYTGRNDRQDFQDYALHKIIKGALQFVVGIFLIPVPVLSIVGIYAIFSGILNIRKGISRL